MGIDKYVSFYNINKVFYRYIQAGKLLYTCTHVPESIKGIAAGFNENRHVFLILLLDAVPIIRQENRVFVEAEVNAFAIGRFNTIRYDDDDIQNMNDMM